MGARAQVRIKDTGVYLYTHWGAESIFQDVHRALKSKAGQARLDDPEYLARIIFDKMQGNDPSPETGFGIGTHQHGDIDNLVIVDCAERMVTFEDHVNHTRVTRSFRQLKDAIE